MGFLNLFGNPGPKSQVQNQTQSQTQPPLTVKPLTTYLGSLLKEAGIEDIKTLPYNGKSVSYDAYPQIKPMEILGRYEAGLTQASYMSRLCYTANVRKMVGVNFINQTPIVFNTALSILRRNMNIQEEVDGASFNAMPYIGPASILYDKTKTHETPCYFQVVDYINYNGPSPYPGERVLYVTFRGTLSLKSAFLTDANITTRSATELFSVCSMEGVKGTDAFVDDINAAESYRFSPGIHPFGIHQGFVLNLAGMIGDICQTLERTLKSTPIDRIIVTGHSLGAANASVASLIFAGFKRAGVACLQRPKIHAMTFGAPKLFLDYTRLVYNRLLDGGFLTLDRVAGRMENLVLGMASAGVAIDLVPTIPPNLVHPGYMILKHEFKTQSRTGRSKNISDIREMFGAGGTKAAANNSALGKLKAYTIGTLKSYSEFNGLPYYAEFLACFEPAAGITQENYEKKFMNLPFATVYKGPGADNVVYEGVKALVKMVLGKMVVDSNQEGDVVEAKEEGKKEEKLEAAAVPSSNNALPNNSQAQAQAQAGGFALVSKAKQEYETGTLANGPNHVVYSCKKNISPFSCHLAYMGVGYGGLSAGDIGYSPPALSYFIVENGKILYSIPKGPNYGGKRKMKKTRRHKKLVKKSRRIQKH